MKIIYFLLLALLYSCSSTETEKVKPAKKEKIKKPLTEKEKKWRNYYEGYVDSENTEGSAKEDSEESNSPRELSIVHQNTAKEIPAPPFLMYGCQGECCGILKSNLIKDTLTLKKYPFFASEVIGKVEKGDVASSITHFIKILEPKTTIYNENEVKVLHYVSEGSYLFFDGKNFIIDAPQKILVDDPVVEEWVKINHKGLSGWTQSIGDPMDPESPLDLRWCG
ncbi:MAG: hypothetical protein CME70_03925 [Halobacteriovorax sp.]|nr:hypothetical protein [Halobacteriovorax sp.]|tara:strand:+ start:126750 stop:127418 length:669 start_codon:yes stop_codon:yes gene_type:complete